MDLLYFLKVLFRKKWIIIGVTLLAMITAFLLVSFQKPLYESRAQYSTGFTLEKVKLSEVGTSADIYAANTKFDNVIETFMSPRVIGMISYKLLLHDLENPASAWRTLSAEQKEGGIYKSVNKDSVIMILTKKLNNNELLRSDVMNERKVLEYLKLYQYDYYSIIGHLIINRVAKTDYLDIVFRSNNPYLSAWIVNALGMEFINYYKSLSFQRTEENIESIRELVRHEQERIDSLNSILYAENVRRGTIDPAVLSESAMQTIQLLEGRLAEERSRYELSKNRLDFYLKTQENKQNVSGANSSQNAELIELTNRKNNLESELIAKGGFDPKIEAELSKLRIRINTLSMAARLNTGISSQVDDLQQKINEQRAIMNAADATIKSYNSKINYYQGLTNLNPGSGVTIEIIRSRLDMEQKQLANLKEKLNQAQGLSKDIPTSNFTQTLVGQPAVEPEPKNLLTKTGISGISVFFLSCFAFLFIEIFNTSIKTPYGFIKIVKLNLLGVLNSVKIRRRSIGDIVLLEHHKENNDAVFKNNVRKLRYEIANSNKSVFLFTSTRKSSGKSTTIEAVATGMLLSKKKVLIIDFNMHHNTLTDKFNAEVFIQDIAEKYKSSLPVMGQKIASSTEWNNLEIIGCQESNFTPSEVLFNFDLAGFLADLKERYDFIFIEGPALNKYSDSKELVKYVDKVITVFSAENEFAQTDKVSADYIRKLGEKNMGGVLNNVLPENISF